MALGEFELIRRYFTPHNAPPGLLGVGDDAAVLPSGEQLYATQASWHSDGGPLAPAAPLARALLGQVGTALAARGARPRWLLLSLTLPAVDEAWLRAFASALDAGARQRSATLVGGDTTRGPACIELMCLGPGRG